MSVGDDSELHQGRPFAGCASVWTVLSAAQAISTAQASLIAHLAQPPPLDTGWRRGQSYLEQPFSVIDRRCGVSLTMPDTTLPLDDLTQQFAQHQSELERLRQEIETRQTRLTDLEGRRAELRDPTPAG